MLWQGKFYVYGMELEGKNHLWMFESIEAAKCFADRLCRDTGHEYLILQKLGRVTVSLPVEFKAE